MVPAAMVKAFLASKSPDELRDLLRDAEKDLSDSQFLAVVDVAKEGLARRWPETVQVTNSAQG